MPRLQGSYTLSASIWAFFELKRIAELGEKHLFVVQSNLQALQSLYEEKKIYREPYLLKNLDDLETFIMISPMRKVKHACLSSAHSMEVPSPPTIPLLATLELKGRVYSQQIERFLKKDLMSGASKSREETPPMVQERFDAAIKTYRKGISLADESESTRSGANLRLAFASLLCRLSRSGRFPGYECKEKAELMMDWIIEKGNILGNELVSRAETMKQQLDNSEIVDIVMAMNVISGYNYGGSWSAHWFECPNGHPYFIGECGGAMQESNCPECGARIGGRSHVLNELNRPAEGLISQIGAELP
jgi:hypothetical protein